MKHLFEKLEEYSNEGYYPYHMPGHKRNLYGSFSANVLKMDITEIDGFDNLHQPEGILEELQERAAKLYGAEESYYLVNGSTCGILSAISAVVDFGEHILMARNSHKSAYHAVYLRNLTVSYLYPSFIKEYDIFDAVTPEQVKKALEENQDISAVFLVSPTYEGRIADIGTIAKIVHAKGIPLIVDEAHGAHLGFAEGFAQNSCQLGADIVIHSVHKTLPAMTQTALLHVNGNLIDRERLQRFLHIYQSSSPSYILMASIDNALNIVEKQGKVLFQHFLERYTNLCKRLSICKGLEFFSQDTKKQDVGKLVISSKKFHLSGQQIYDILLQTYHLQLEMAAGNYCLAMFTIGDSKEAYDRMEKALLEIDSQIISGEIVPIDYLTQNDNCMVRNTNIASAVKKRRKNTLANNYVMSISLAEAWDQPFEMVLLEDAADCCVAEFVNLYPPGIPLFVPGEVITKADCKQLLDYILMGLHVQGVQKRKEAYWIKILKLKET